MIHTHLLPHCRCIRHPLIYSSGDEEASNSFEGIVMPFIHQTIQTTAKNVSNGIKRNGIHLTHAYQTPTLTHVYRKRYTRDICELCKAPSWANLHFFVQFPSLVWPPPPFFLVPAHALNFKYYKIQYSNDWCQKPKTQRIVKT